MTERDASLEIIFVDDDPSAPNAETPVSEAVGAPVTRQATQQAAEDAPARADFQGLTSAIQSLTTRIAKLATGDDSEKLPEPKAWRQEERPRASDGAPTKPAVKDEIDKLAESIMDRLNPANSRWGRMAKRAAKSRPVRVARAAAARLQKTRAGRVAKIYAKKARRRGSRIKRAVMGTAAGRGAATIAARVGAVVTRIIAPLGVSIGAATAGLAAATAGLLALAGAAWLVHKRFQSLAEEIAEFSGPVSAAMAQIELERELRRIELAQKIGPAVAAQVAARGRLEDAIGDLKISLLEELARFQPLAEGFVDIGTAGVRAVHAAKESLDVLITLGQDPNEKREAAAAAAKLQEAVEDIFRANAVAANGQLDQPLKDLLNRNRVLAPNPAQVPPNRVNP